MRVQIKRVYEPVGATDGYRVLVDRLWPRGISKETAKLGVWLKEVAPSAELRTWFGHRPERFAEFRVRYESELGHNPAFEELKQLIAKHDTVTLLYGAHDPVHNQAQVLAQYLKQ